MTIPSAQNRQFAPQTKAEKMDVFNFRRCRSDMAHGGYDVIDRAFSPYIGVNYEASFGDTKDILRANGDDTDAFSIVIGTRLMF